MTLVGSRAQELTVPGCLEPGPKATRVNAQKPRV